ncbi:MAG: DUF4280 domain-containing protein [Lachnospiraceae bacterium]|nr:DUF4280 domain-containing protein [Lachnospiraceae bacterium]
MSQLIVTGASCKCSFGMTPGVINATNNLTVLAESKPVCVMADAAPGVNVTPFGMCTTLSNPQVAAATAAAMGVLTPQPCMPAITGTWTGGKVLIGGKPCLTMESTCMCAYGGVINIVNPGQTNVIVS